MARKLTIADRFNIVQRKLTDAFKSVLIDDIPPNERLRREGRRPPFIEEQEAFIKKYNSLSDILPYESYDPEKKIYYNEDSVGFLLYASPCTGLNATTLTTLNGFYNQSHEPDTNIQVTMIGDPNIEGMLKAWKGTKNRAIKKKSQDIFDLLAEKREAFFKNGKWKSLLKDQSYLVKNHHILIAYTVPVPVGIAPIDVNPSVIDKLLRMREQTIGTLQSANIYSAPADPEWFINVMNGLLNPSYDESTQLIYNDNNMINEQMVDADSVFLFSSGQISVTHKEKSFSVLPYQVKKFPREWPGYLNSRLIGSFDNDILRMPCPFIATLTINVPDQISIKGKVKSRSMRATQMASSNVAKYVPQWSQRKADWQFTESQLDSGNRMLESFYQVILIAPEGSEEACEQSLFSIYDSFGWNLNRSRYTPKHALISALPMAITQETKRALKIFKMYRSTVSSVCTNITPWIGEWKGTETPMMIMNGRRGQLAFLDPFDNKKGNYNMSISATSGSGKSFVAQELVFSSLAFGGRAFIIDAGHSYKELCQLQEGTYLDFGEGTPNLNPFTNIFSKQAMDEVARLEKINPKEYNLDGYISDMMPMLILLIGVMASPDKKLDQGKQSYLEMAIKSAIKKYSGKTTITKVRDELNGMVGDDQKTIKEAKELALALFSYTDEGMHGRYFEGDNNVDLSNPLVVLELDALNAKGDLQGVALLILMSQINQVMYLSGNKSQRKLVIIDEAWRLLGKGRAGEFIEEGYRVARKHGGSFITITQKISDYFQSETAMAAYANSDWKIYLRQDPNELTTSTEKGYIDNSSGKVDLIRSLETVQGKYSEMAVDSPSGMAVLRFSVDPFTEKIYSTQAKEVEYLKQAQADGASLISAIEKLVEQQGAR